MTSPTPENVRLRPAIPTDLEAILGMMPFYYADDHLDFIEARARAAISELIAEPGLGGVFLIDADPGIGAPIGYLAYCTLFSVEYGGRGALIDEFYVRSDARGRGIGSRAMAEAIARFRAMDLRAIRLETTPTNARARALYERLGFRDLRRSLLAYPLSS